MGYDGNIAIIPMGAGGLYTDDPHTIIPSTKLTLATNVILQNGKVEKDLGSRRWNDTVFPSGVKCFIDWWPDRNTQRQIVVTADGRVRRLRTRWNESLISPVLGSPSFLIVNDFVTMAPCGNEQAGNDKKLFIFTGNDPVQVISGDGTTRRDIEKPAADWAERNQPLKGLIHKGRMICLYGDRIYFSSATDHEDFTTSPLQFPVFPGEGEKLIDAIVFKGRLFLFKYPNGVYYLSDSDPSVANWELRKLNANLGAASPNSALQVLDDVLVANNYGTMTSLKATEAFGDITMADLYMNLRVEEFIRNQMAKSSGNERHAIYYADRKVVYVSYRSSGGYKNDRIVKINFSKQAPEITMVDKDQPSCMGFIKDVFGIDRPVYGADDGYLYEMDVINRDVVGVGYKGQFQTPNFDLGFGNQLIGEASKNFDFIEFAYEPTGDFDLNVDIFIDGRYSETQTVKLKGLATLGEMQTGDKLGSDCPYSVRIQIGGEGRRISVRCYNEGVGENFKIVGLNIYYQLLGNRQIEN